VNGRSPDSVAVRSGQRVRLRLVNVSNARNFALRFESHEPIVIAMDGQPVVPHRPPGGTLVLGAAMRIDVVLDCALDPGSESRVIDTFYPDRAFLLTTLAYGPEATVDTGVRNKPVSLSPNPLGEPILDAATEHEIVLAGGAMGGLRGAMLDGRWADMRRLVDEGIFWTMGGVARHPDAFTPPMLTLSRGSSHVVTLRNETAFPHPIHLHGHHFRVLSRNGETTPFTPWQDSVLVASREQVRIAFRADNPGDWLFHCHVLEHMAAGMSGVVRVL